MVDNKQNGEQQKKCGDKIPIYNMLEYNQNGGQYT